MFLFHQEWGVFLFHRGLMRRGRENAQRHDGGWGTVCGCTSFQFCQGSVSYPCPAQWGHQSPIHPGPKAGVQDLPFWNLKAGYAPAEAESLGARALPGRQGALGAVWMPVLRSANHGFSTDCFCLIEPDLGPVAYSELWMIYSRSILYTGSPSSQRNLPVLERTGGDKLGSMCVGQHTSEHHREQWKGSPCGSWCRATPRTFLREMENSFSHCLQCVASSSFSHVWPCGGRPQGWLAPDGPVAVF